MGSEFQGLEVFSFDFFVLYSSWFNFFQALYLMDSRFGDWGFYFGHRGFHRVCLPG